MVRREEVGKVKVLTASHWPGLTSQVQMRSSAESDSVVSAMSNVVISALCRCYCQARVKNSLAYDKPFVASRKSMDPNPEID